MVEQVEIQKTLREKYGEARLRNPSYSLSAFARSLKLSPGALSAILNGKRKISSKLALKIAQNLLLGPEETQRLLKNFTLTRQKIKSHYFVDEGRYLKLKADQFNLISEWEHWALFSLVKIKGFKTEPLWIARRLGISENRASVVVNRLLELGLLKMKTDTYVRSKGKLEFSSETQNIAIQRAHVENLELIKGSIVNTNVSDRDLSFVTLTINPKNLADIKSKINIFQAELADQFENIERGSEVYRLSVYLNPLTKQKGA